jgi:hypothetical protein
MVPNRNELFISSRALTPDTLFYAHPRNDSPDMQVRIFEPFCIKRVDNRLEAFVVGQVQCISDFGAIECAKDQMDMFFKEARMEDFLGEIQRIELKSAVEMMNRSQVIRGTTMMTTIGHDCHNTWHFFNRAAGWWHVLEYMKEMGIGSIDRVLIERDGCLRKLTSAVKDDMWLSSVANAIFAPQKLNFEETLSLNSFAGLKNQVAFYSDSIKYSFSSEPICFEKLVIPGRTRFFVTNFVNKDLMDSCSLNAPKSAIRFRKAVRSYLGYETKQQISKKIVYAIRVNNRRGFSSVSEDRFQQLLYNLSSKHGYELEIVDFHGSFKFQYDSVQDASIMIGIHGQNLINSIFLPCNSSLIEIFPFGFWSDAYRQGGYSGVHYHSIQSSVYRKPPPFISEYNNSIQVCNAHVHCRYYYKDKTNMRLSESDWIKLAQLIERVMMDY